MFSAGETVTVIRPPQRDRFGDRIGTDTEHTIDGCGINQEESSEAGSLRVSAKESDRRNTVLTRVELLCPPGADIRAGDKVRLPNGSVYEVDGNPWTPHNPFTAWEPGLIAKLRGISDAP
ncbi:hypothetical protein ACWDSF_06330 [Nocardia beijingensis]